MNKNSISTRNQLVRFVFFSFIFFHFVSGLSAQQSILQKAVTIRLQDISLSEALLALGEQVGVTISYSNNQLDVNRKVSINAIEQPLGEVMEELLGSDLKRLLVSGNQISIQTNTGSGIINGMVSSPEGTPIAHASLYIDGKAAGHSNEAGHFVLNRVPEGSHELRVSYIGYQAQQKSVQLAREGSIRVDFQMEIDNRQLQTIEVIGRKESSYRNSTTFSATKSEVPIKEVPQAISYVTKETMEDQLAFRVSDAVKNISGVNQSTSNNRNFVIRGFDATSKLINGMRVVTEIRSQTMLPNIERIEVLKGPASALYANTDPGGTINLVTKKPLDEARKSINFATGSYNTNRLTADFTGPMNNSKTLLYRLNLAYQNNESFRVLQGGKYSVLAPSFSFIPSDRTRVNVELVYQMNDTRFDRGQPIFGGSNQEDLYSTPISFAIAKRNDFTKEQFLSSNISFEHKFSDHLRFNASYMKSMYDEDLLEHRTSNDYAVDADGNEIPTLVSMMAYRRLAKNTIDNLSAYFNFTAKTGGLQHQILLGYDRIQEIFPLYNATQRARGYLSADGSRSYSSYDPEKRDLYMIVDNMPVPNVPHFDLQNPDYSISAMDQYFTEAVAPDPRKSFQNGIYVQDYLKIGKFSAVLGLRREFYTNVEGYTSEEEENITQHAWIPRVGLVFTPNETVSFYGNFSEGYQPQTASIIGDPEIYGGPFDPLTSRIYELGAKMDFFNKALSVTSAVYDITQNNILINANDNENPDMLRQIGQQRARGFELDVYGSIRPNLSITAAFSYNNAKIMESEVEEEVGMMMPNAPKSQGNIWVKYLFQRSGWLNGIGIALGSNYATERVMGDMGTIRLPAYVLANAAAYYQIDRFKLSTTFNNVFNKTHWLAGHNLTRLYPGTPRNFMLGIGYTF